MGIVMENAVKKGFDIKKIIFIIADIIIAGLLILADQLIKNYVVLNLELNTYVKFWPGFIYLEHLHNHGAAFSSFENKKFFLLLIGVIFLAFIVYLIIKMPVYKKFIPAYIFLAMLIGGGVGNMIDRIRLGYVVDYIGLDFWKTYPIFNFADCCVVLGVIGLFILFIFVYKDNDLDFLRFFKNDKNDKNENNNKSES